MSGLLAHKIPGRVRLKLPSLKGNRSLADHVMGRLSAFPAIKKVRINPAAGSLELLYDAALMQESAALVIAELKAIFGGYDFSELERHFLGIVEEILVTPYGIKLAQNFASFNRGIRQNLNGVDLAFLVPASLFSLGFYRLITAKPIPAPRWFDLWWYGFSIFMIVNRPSSLPLKDNSENKPFK
jgi:hypothetical protein